MALARLLLPLLSALALLPAAAGAYCSLSFERDGIAYLMEDGDLVRRFDLAAGSWLPPIPLAPGPQYPGLDAADGVVWVRTYTAIRALDEAGAVLREIANPDLRDFALADGHVFVLSGNALESYDAATAALQATVPLTGYTRTRV